MPTPMMQQYQEAKQACPEAILLFRMGDFYELFFDDAKVAAAVLNIALTSREKGDGAIPMAGFPHHALENYLGKLIAAGHRVAIADQVEDPKEAKGLVKRAITRIVTPGTLTDEALLDPKTNNYLAAVAVGKQTGLAWIDMSTGQFYACEIPPARLADELARIDPAECLLSETAQLDLDPRPQRPQLFEEGEPPEGEIIASTPVDERLVLTRRPPWCFDITAAKEALNRHFGTLSLEGFGWEADGPAICAAGAILDYLQETQRENLPHIDKLTPYGSEQTLQIDAATRRSLELVRTMREGRREGSLLGVLDRTVTAMGSRLLGDWLANPLTDLAALNRRLDAVGEAVEHPELIDSLRELLKGAYDVERLVTRVATGRAGPRDLSQLARTLAVLPKLKAKLTARQSALWSELESDIDLTPDLRSQLETALVEECPLASKEGGFIREGFNRELDELRELASGGKQWIAQYQAAEAERTGITSLKVGFNKVFGYYLEVTNAHKDKVPEEYTRKQTLKNAERYITPELKEYEEKVLTAVEKAQELEYDLFVELRTAVEAARRRLQATARVLAQIDVLLSFAVLARQRNYCRPELVEEPRLEIRDSRHPVLDILEPEGTFVPNDVEADAGGQFLLLITGPNMAGKSTYIRQVALLTLMAQLGSFVPAAAATIGIADRIFARVGASDELSRGQSTFMVEMTESARILNTATPRSLIILDEIGRGTSTYDGVSLAWAVVEHIHSHVAARTLFATHYHELTALAAELPGVKNLNVAVQEWKDEVVFLHKIVEGAADKSYGIHVARLAGVPRPVIDRAGDILSQLEAEHQVDAADHIPPVRQAHNGTQQLSLFADDHPVLDALRELDVDNLTPLEALKRLKEWQEALRD